jgi:DNA-binding XRE family transcriptional regulator
MNPVKTALGAAIREKRGSSGGRIIGRELKVDYSTISRLESGDNLPSPPTALALARWLGWTMEQVYEAAATPISRESGNV